MSATRTAEKVFDEEFLNIRAKLLELAAALDRVDRADGTVDEDSRWKSVRAATKTLLDADHDRAEKVQLIFSRTYEKYWRRAFKLG